MSVKFYSPMDLADEVIELFKLEDDLRDLGVSNPDWLMEELSRRGWECRRQAVEENAA